MVYYAPRRRPHHYYDAYGHLMIDGETFIGRNRVPPMPFRIAVTDRTTGDIRVLSHDGSLVIDLVPVQPYWRDVNIFGPYDGPFASGYRLFLDNGILTFEPATQSQEGGKILTRRNFETTVLQLLPNPDGTVSYTVFAL